MTTWRRSAHKTTENITKGIVARFLFSVAVVTGVAVFVVVAVAIVVLVVVVIIVVAFVLKTFIEIGVTEKGRRKQ